MTIPKSCSDCCSSSPGCSAGRTAGRTEEEISSGLPLLFAAVVLILVSVVVKWVFF
jgi:hypothetical protein